MSGTQKSASQNAGAQNAGARDSKPEPKILYQSFFKSVGTRTYVAQVKESGNGNHFIVLTEGRRDPATDEIRKTRLLCFSEDFDQFFKMVTDLAQFTRANPVPREIAQRQAKFWEKQHAPANKTAPDRRGGSGARSAMR